MIRKAKICRPGTPKNFEALPKWARNSPWVIGRRRTKLTLGDAGGILWSNDKGGRPTKNSFAVFEAVERKHHATVARVAAEVAALRGEKNPLKQIAAKAERPRRCTLILREYKKLR